MMRGMNLFERPVSEYMSAPVCVVSADDTAEDANKIMSEKRISVWPWWAAMECRLVWCRGRIFCGWRARWCLRRGVRLRFSFRRCVSAI